MADVSAPRADLRTQIRTDSATRGRGLRARSANRPHGASARLPARRNVWPGAPVASGARHAKSAGSEADAATMAGSRLWHGASYGSPPIQAPPLRTGPSLRQPDESAGTVVWCFAYGCDVHQGSARAGTLMTGFRVRPVAARRCLRPRNGVAPVDLSAEPKESTAAGMIEVPSCQRNHPPGPGTSRLGDRWATTAHGCGGPGASPTRRSAAGGASLLGKQSRAVSAGFGLATVGIRRLLSPVWDKLSQGDAGTARQHEWETLTVGPPERPTRRPFACPSASVR